MVIVMEKKMLSGIYSSQARLAGVAIWGMSLLSVGYGQTPINDQIKNEVQQTISHLEKHKFISENFLHHVHIMEDDSSKLIDSRNIQNRNLKGECVIDVTYGATGKAIDLSGNRKLPKLATLNNEAQVKLLRQFILLHEANHCEFTNISQPFLVEGNPELEKGVNSLLKNSRDLRGIGGIYDLLNETFADTYALLQMIQMHGITPDMQDFLVYVESLRKDNFLRMAINNQVEAHSTHFGIEEVLTPGVLEKAQKNVSSTDLKHLALEIANRGMLKSLTYDTNTSLAVWLSEKSLVESILESAVIINVLQLKNTAPLTSRIGYNALDLKENTSWIYGWSQQLLTPIGWNDIEFINSEGKYRYSAQRFHFMKELATPIVYEFLKTNPNGYQTVLNDYKKYISSFQMNPQDRQIYRELIADLGTRLENKPSLLVVNAEKRFPVRLPGTTTLAHSTK